MPIEDDLLNMFRYAGVGKGQGTNALLNTLIRNVQLNTLKMMRQQIDKNIQKLQGEAKASGGGSGYDASLDPYKILGVDQSATREEIDKAFKKKAWSAHPDHGGSNEDMIRVNASYEAIRQFRGWR